MLFDWFVFHIFKYFINIEWQHITFFSIVNANIKTFSFHRQSPVHMTIQMKTSMLHSIPLCYWIMTQYKFDFVEFFFNIMIQNFKICLFKILFFKIVFRHPNVMISRNKFYITIKLIDVLTLQRLKHVGFLYTFTSKYTLKHIRLMKFYKTFTTKDTSVSINDSIRLVSKPFIYSLFKLLYYLNFSYLLSIPHLKEWAFRTFL